MLTIGICDDEKEIRDKIKNVVEKTMFDDDRDYRIKTFSSGEELLQENIGEIDILFLDIIMGDINGMDTARKIRENDKNMEIIFITSLVDYISDGYEVRAYRYLLKPVDEEIVAKHLKSCIKDVEDSKGKYMVVKSDDGIKKIYQRDILYIEVLNTKVIIHSEKGNSETRQTLSEIKNELDSNMFYHCQKSFIVNLDYINKIKGYEAVLENGECIPIGRTKYKDLKEKFFWRLGGGN